MTNGKMMLNTTLHFDISLLIIIYYPVLHTQLIHSRHGELGFSPGDGAIRPLHT